MMALVTTTPAVLMVVVALFQQAPVRDRVAAPVVVVTGTATVSGVVLTGGDSPQPVRHATVALATGVISLPHMVVTDAEGRFTFRDLAGGSYRIAAQKTAWVPVAKPLPVAVKDGETIAGLTLRLQRGAVISGVVRVPDGGVAAGMSVQAFRTTRVDGTRSASMMAEPASTDDEGRYRIFGLPPGEYVVQVRSQFLPSQAGELRQVLPSEVGWAEAALAQATLAQSALPPAPEAGPTVAYSTTYFPGTAYLSEATGVTVRAGEEHLNVDMHILRVPTAVVSGRVTGLDGAPAVSAMVTLTLPATTGQEDLIGQLIGASRVATRADGTFVLPGVPPGAYTLTVRATPPAPAGGRGAPATAE
jgi:hypothetical protein